MKCDTVLWRCHKLSILSLLNVATELEIKVCIGDTQFVVYFQFLQIGAEP